MAIPIHKQQKIVAVSLSIIGFVIFIQFLSLDFTQYSNIISQQQQRDQLQQANLEKPFNHSTLIHEIDDIANSYCIPNQITSVPAEYTNYPTNYPYYRIFAKPPIIRSASNTNSTDSQQQQPSDNINVSVAVCKFRQIGPWSEFPHTMQQLYRCFSFFQLYSNSANHTYERVLLISTIPNSYSQSFINLINKIWNITIITKNNDSTRNLYTYYLKNEHNPNFNTVIVSQPDTTKASNNRFPSYQVLSYLHMKILRDGIIYGLGAVAATTTTTSSSSSSSSLPPPAAATTTRRLYPTCNDLPRIGILNREYATTTVGTAGSVREAQHHHQQPQQQRPLFLNQSEGSRHILNHLQIKNEIENQFNSSYVSNNGTVIYQSSFNNLTMEQQVLWMSNIDILISPHGAQLISVPYMPDCGSILEIFPTGFYLPSWYGQLASSANLHHATLYDNSGDGSSGDGNGSRPWACLEKYPQRW